MSPNAHEKLSSFLNLRSLAGQYSSGHQLSQYQSYFQQLEELVWDVFQAYRGYTRVPFEIEFPQATPVGSALKLGEFVGGIISGNDKNGSIRITIARDQDLGNWFLFEPNDISAFFNREFDFRMLVYVIQSMYDFFYQNNLYDTQITLHAVYYDWVAARDFWLYDGARDLLTSLLE